MFSRNPRNLLNISRNSVQNSMQFIALQVCALQFNYSIESLVLGPWRRRRGELRRPRPGIAEESRAIIAPAPEKRSSL